MPSVRVVTINTGKCDGPYHARIDWMAEELVRLDPDIVACQESFSAADGSAVTAVTLARRLGMFCAAAPARFKTRSLEGRSVAGWSGLALLGRRPWLEQEIVTLPDDARDGERVAQFAVAEHGGGEVVMANVHLSHLAGADGLRGTQLTRVLTHPWLRRPRALRLICGDFNMTADGAVLAPLLAAGIGPLGVRDSYACGGGGEPRGTLAPRPAHCSGDAPCIDFILSIAGVSAAHPRFRDAAICLDRAAPATEIYPSDHFGVTVTADW